MSTRRRNMRIRLAYLRACYGSYLLNWAVTTAVGSAALAGLVWWETHR